MEFLKLIFKFNWHVHVSRLRGNLFWIWSWTSELNESLDPLILRNFGWFNSTCVRFLTGNFKTAIIYSGHVLFVIWNDPAHSNDKQNQSSNIAYNCWYLKSQEGLSRLAFLFRTVEKLFIQVNLCMCFYSGFRSICSARRLPTNTRDQQDSDVTYRKMGQTQHLP